VSAPAVAAGRLGSEPEVKYLDNGNCVLSVSLAVNRDFSSGRGAMGEKPEVDWIKIEVWGRYAEIIAQQAKKG
jgi:single-strand DNA-binding protein